MLKTACCCGIENIRFLKESGYDYIELAGKWIAALTDDEFKDICKRIYQLDMTCCAFNATLQPKVKICGPGFDEQIISDYADIICRRGNSLGVKIIGIGCPRSRILPDNFPYLLAIEQSKIFMTILCKEAVQYGISVLWEPLNPLMTNFGISMMEGVDIVEQIGLSNSGIVCDFYHMFVNQEEPKILELSADFVKHLHFSKKVGRERQYLSMNDLQLFEHYLPILKRHQYRGIISLEAFDGSFEAGVTTTLEMFNEVNKRFFEDD